MSGRRDAPSGRRHRGWSIGVLSCSGLLAAGAAADGVILAQSPPSKPAISSAMPAVESPGGQSAERVTDVRVGRTPGRTRIVFDFSGVPRYHVSTIADPHRVVIELEDAQFVAAPAATLFIGTPVVHFESDAGGNGQRVVLDLDGSSVRAEAFVLKPYEDAGHRLVLDLYEVGEDAPGTAASLPVASVGARSVPGPAPVRPAAANTHLHKPATAASAPAKDSESAFGSDIRTGGYGEVGAAYTYPGNAHWSQLRARLELNMSGDLPGAARFRVVGRAQGDAAYTLEDDYYPQPVRKNQESDAEIREAYLDFSLGEWEYRLGKQHVVWGEMVGFFVADVVSARDTREFDLPDFESIRIGQWAVRAERFSGDSHFELLWVPYVSYDEVGKPGADFYPYPLPPGTPVNEVTPGRNKLSNTNYGARYSYLVSGWDLAAFYYQSNDVNPTLYSLDSELELRHDRIQQAGSTFSKDYQDFVLKGEAVYTSGRGFVTSDPMNSTGVEQGDSLEYIVGVMLPRGDWRFDLQFYGQHVFDYGSSLTFDEDEVGVTLLVNRRFGDAFEAELLYLAGLNRADYSWQPSVTWNITQTWKLQLGADIFGGDQLGYFGRFDDSDRVFFSLKNWF